MTPLGAGDMGEAVQRSGSTPGTQRRHHKILPERLSKDPHFCRRRLSRDRCFRHCGHAGGRGREIQYLWFSVRGMVIRSYGRSETRA